MSVNPVVGFDFDFRQQYHKCLCSSFRATPAFSHMEVKAPLVSFCVMITLPRVLLACVITYTELSLCTAQKYCGAVMVSDCNTMVL